MQKTFLVTGAAGFVGSNFIRHLLYTYKGCKVIGLDYLADSKSMHNIYANKAHEFYIADVTDKHVLEKIFEIHRPNYVIHCAAPAWDSYYDDVLKTNVLGSHNVAVFSKKFNIEKLIYISDGKIYNSPNARATEQSPIKAIDILTTSVIGAENVMTICNIPSIVFRTSSIFGPRSSCGENKITYLYRNRLSSLSVCNAQPGDLLCVEDLNVAILLGIEKQLKGVFNLSIENDFTDQELHQIIINQTEEKVEKKFTTTDKPVVKLDSKKFRDATGWKPQRSLKAQIQHTIQWYTNNKWFSE